MESAINMAKGALTLLFISKGHETYSIFNQLLHKMLLADVMIRNTAVSISYESSGPGVKASSWLVPSCQGNQT